MRSFKPALARDYDVFFAAIGLLCGGILFFQGWRLDPILQFGQFLLAGTTVFFGYESVRLRGITADQARRSTFFDDDPPLSRMPGRGNDQRWDDSFDPYENFDEPGEVRRRFSGRNPNDVDSNQQDSYRPRRTTRAAIPEEAASRNRDSRDYENSWEKNNERSRRMGRFNSSTDVQESRSSFGERRSLRQDQRRGSRPAANSQRSNSPSLERGNSSSNRGRYSDSSVRRGDSMGANPSRPEPQDAAFSPRSSKQPSQQNIDPGKMRKPSSGSYSKSPKPSQKPRNPRPRDNNSRFDD